MPMLARITMGLVLWSASAAADTPSFNLVEDAVFGGEAVDGKAVLSEKHRDAMAKCATTGASSGALFWLELDRSGAVTAARVHGSGKPTVDSCLEKALRKASPRTKLPSSVVVGHIDLPVAGGEGYHPSPRLSKTAILVAPHAAKWQVSVEQLAYTANRAADLAQALDGASVAIAACAAKRADSAGPAIAFAWIGGGKAIVRSGAPAYDACLANALEAIKLPAAESAAWMKLSILAPAAPLAPRTNKPESRDQALRDALTTAVRSRKDQLRTCLDGKPKLTLVKVGLALAATKATLARVSTGDAAVDACVRKKFGEVAIPNATAADKLELEITLDRE